ncbi:MAG: hemerythrin domain-containing protein [Sulfurimonas sp.]|nr:hemerythrin domain-containing protein [Sulfurimonas sp.]
MSNIKEYLSTEHTKCDDLFVKMEETANMSLEEAQKLCKEFMEATEHHFQIEERVVFPKFEEKTGMVEGPTQMMKHEHTQMRALMKNMLASLESGNKDKFFGYSETLMILLQQHNMKEEQMLYPMMQQHLNAESDDIVDMMTSMKTEY